MQSLPSGPENPEWILEPLLAAGLGPEEITALLLRVAFEAITRGRELDASLRGMVADRPVPVRAAWIETIGRMIASWGSTTAQ